jgi:hypothetical protein
MFATEGVENMESMHKSYETCEFPQNEARADFDPSFSTTVIYWKPLSQEEETEEEKGKGKEKEIVDDKEDEKEDEKKEDKDEDENDLSKKLESTTIS